VYGAHTSHRVRIEPGTLLRRITHDEAIGISSHHHQAVDLLGDGLVASATAPDGCRVASARLSRRACACAT
jgi:putative glutamine amidotransferase